MEQRRSRPHTQATKPPVTSLSRVPDGDTGSTQRPANTTVLQVNHHRELIRRRRYVRRHDLAVGRTRGEEGGNAPKFSSSEDAGDGNASAADGPKLPQHHPHSLLDDELSPITSDRKSPVHIEAASPPSRRERSSLVARRVLAFGGTISQGAAAARSNAGEETAVTEASETARSRTVAGETKEVSEPRRDGDPTATAQAHDDSDARSAASTTTSSRAGTWTRRRTTTSTRAGLTRAIQRGRAASAASASVHKAAAEKQPAGVGEDSDIILAARPDDAAVQKHSSCGDHTQLSAAASPAGNQDGASSLAARQFYGDARSLNARRQQQEQPTHEEHHKPDSLPAGHGATVLAPVSSAVTSAVLEPSSRGNNGTKLSAFHPRTEGQENPASAMSRQQSHGSARSLKAMHRHPSDQRESDSALLQPVIGKESRGGEGREEPPTLAPSPASAAESAVRRRVGENDNISQSDSGLLARDQKGMLKTLDQTGTTGQQFYRGIRALKSRQQQSDSHDRVSQNAAEAMSAIRFAGALRRAVVGDHASGGNATSNITASTLLPMDGERDDALDKRQRPQYHGSSKVDEDGTENFRSLGKGPKQETEVSKMSESVTTSASPDTSITTALNTSITTTATSSTAVTKNFSPEKPSPHEGNQIQQTIQSPPRALCPQQTRRHEQQPQCHYHPFSSPLHPEVRYYRIVFRGVVALLTHPQKSSAKSGAYVSYGEIVASSLELDVPLSGSGGGSGTGTSTTGALTGTTVSGAWVAGTDHDQQPPSFPPSSPTRSILSNNSSSISSLESSSRVSSSLPLGGPAPHHWHHHIGVDHCTKGHEMASLSAGVSGMSMASDIATKSGAATAIRVDEVLTGGYAMDANRRGGADSRNMYETAETPRRSNNNDDTVSRTPLSPARSGIAPSAVSGCSSTTSILSSSRCGSGVNGRETSSLHLTSPSSVPTSPPRSPRQSHPPLSSHSHGYLFTKRRNVPIAQRIASPPVCHMGPFLYKVTSSMPLPILAGPRADAPRTRAVALPGTVHEVSLRVLPAEEADDDANPQDGVVFLRLSHRRGWVADRRCGARNSGGPDVLVMREIVDGTVSSAATDDGSVSVVSVGSLLSVSTASALARRRNRPPRRKGSAFTSLGGDKPLGSTKSRGESMTASLSPTTRTWYSRASLREKDDSSSSPHGPLKEPESAMSPVASNVSLLSDDSHAMGGGGGLPQQEPHEGGISDAVDGHVGRSADQGQNSTVVPGGVVAPRVTGAGVAAPSFFLMRVTAPKGLKILDAPHFQVSNLIRGQTGNSRSSAAQQHVIDPTASYGSMSKPSSIFHTMAGSFTHEISTARVARADSTDSSSGSRTRILPRGTLFESSRRMETPGVYTPGSGLIKLSDNSGWAIVPRQDELDNQYRHYQGGMTGVTEGQGTRAFEEVGNAIVPGDDNDTVSRLLLPSSQLHHTPPMSSPSSIWLRIVNQHGAAVSCPPPPPPIVKDDDATSSPSSSTVGSSLSAGGSNIGLMTSQESDVASSVGSAFLDAMFRTPRKQQDRDQREAPPMNGKRLFGAGGGGASSDAAKDESEMLSLPNPIVPCGMCVEVDTWEEMDNFRNPSGTCQAFARLRGGQGWIPRIINGEPYASQVDPPNVRIGSFWFRVQSKHGIKVRQGPSRRASSIKSEDGIYFRFECGEFLRASEVFTVFSRPDKGSVGSHKDYSTWLECFAKLYRKSRSRRAHDSQHSRSGREQMQPSQEQKKHRSLANIATPGEWVQVHSHGRLYLEECAPPSIERHQEGWRYNAVLEPGAQVRKGPSFLSETSEKVLHAGESVLINERVTAHGDRVTWLRLKDGQGWVHDVGQNDEQVMIAHSLRHRSKGGRRRETADRDHESDTPR